MKKKAQSIIIASRGQNTSIICDGKVYWGVGITEINFHHRAGENAQISITCDKLPLIPDEDIRTKDNFKDWINYLMKEVPIEEKEGNSPSQEEGGSSVL